MKMLKQFQITVILFVIFQTSLSYQQTSSNQTDEITPYVIGINTGRFLKGNLKLGNFRHQVAVEKYDELICGGTAITLTIVISAAHCFHGSQVADLAIRAGSLRRESGGQVIGVHSYKIHPKFNFSLIENEIDPPHDIAIVSLIDSMDPALVTPALLPKVKRSYAGHKLIVSGWGGELEELKRGLKFARIKMLKNSECMKIDPLAAKKLCGKSVKHTEGPCYGDSGGPLVSHDLQLGKAVLIGVIAGVQEECANEKSVGFFIDVFKYKVWIDKVIKRLEVSRTRLIDTRMGI